MKGLHHHFVELLVGLVLMISVLSCTTTEEPVFQKMADVQVTNIQKGVVTVTAEAVYYNPNDVGGQLESTDIQLIANGVEAATVQQQFKTELKPKSEFRVPIEVQFPLEKVIQDKNNLISGALNALLKKQVEIEYAGKATVSFVGINIDLPIEYKQMIDIGKKK